jgi:hypothetical protein
MYVVEKGCMERRESLLALSYDGSAQKTIAAGIEPGYREDTVNS